jgi:hypothetical protein
MPDGVIVPIPPGTPIGPGLQTPQLASEIALEKMRRRERELDGIVGAPLATGPDDEVERITGGFRRRYSNGNLYMRGSEGTPFFLDRPTTHRYELRGNSDSFLGFPIADLQVDPADPRQGVTRFEHGSIYFFADGSVFDVQHVSVEFVGFHCFGETDEPSAHDEPYFWFGVLPVNVEQRSAARSRTFTHIDAGQSVMDTLELYRGEPLGLAMSVSLFEHDHGDPDAFKENVDIAVDKAAEKLTHALGEVPAVGPALSLVAEVAFVIGGPELKHEITQLLGTMDDHLSTLDVVLSTRELLQFATSEPSSFEGIRAHFETPLMAGDGATYKAYFAVREVRS